MVNARRNQILSVAISFSFNETYVYRNRKHSVWMQSSYAFLVSIKQSARQTLPLQHNFELFNNNKPQQIIPQALSSWKKHGMWKKLPRAAPRG